MILELFWQAVQIVGATLILAAFAAAQWGWSHPASRAYLLANLFGAVLLATSALVAEQWGFVMLNVVWTGVALQSLWKSYAARA